MNKLLIYGDSILRGITYSEELGKHKLCENYKLPKIQAMGYDIRNHSRMGATVGRGYDILCGNLQECEAGDTVLFEYGGNDCDYDWAAISEDPSGSFLPHTPEDTFIETLEAAINTVRKRGARAMLATLIPVDSEKYLSWITKDRSYENIYGWLGDTSMLYRFQEHYNRLVEETARSLSCPIVDFRGTFLLSHRYRDLMAKDGIHPTEEGHAIVEDLILDALGGAVYAG